MAADPTFRMTVQDVFTIRGRGTVVTGRVERGVLKTGDEIYISREGSSTKTKVTGIEAFRKLLTQAQAGDNIGVLMQGIDKAAIQRGDVLTGSI